MSPRDIEAIVVAEFRYWRSACSEDEHVTCMEMGAMGACANILAAIHGHPASWHPTLEPEPRLQPVPGFPGWINTTERTCP